eukprot:jgi/Phyca11/19339/fgenesh1_pg.PHYCAscaffold_47_\
MNSEKPASRMNPMASQKTRPRTTSSNRSARKQTATSPAEPAPRFDELPTAERNAKTAKGEHQKSPEAQEQERREQYLWNRKVEAALKMAKEIKAAARIREVTAKVMESAGSRKSRGVKRSVADMYDDESSTNSKNSNENSDESPTKKTNRGSMSLPWSAWEIDLREKDQSDCGSTSGTLNNCGAKDDYGATSMRIEEIRKIVAQEPPAPVEGPRQRIKGEDDNLRGHKNRMNYKQKMKMTESRMEASSVTEYGYLKPRL